MNRAIYPLTGLALFLAFCLAPAWASEPSPAALKSAISFPLDIAILDPAAQEKLPPYLIMFPEGVDEDGRDVRGPLSRLEALRGASKMFPEVNKDPGLPVVLRGLRIHRNQKADGSLAGYEIELQGEFNAIRVPVDLAEATKFLAGEPASFALKGEKNYGVYSYVSTTTIELQLTGDEVVIRKLEGEFTFREGFSTFKSKTLKLSPPTGRKYLYRGELAELPKLPLI
jgi:hypothetical protein